MKVLIDIDKLRSDLIDYLGAGMFNGIPALMMEMIDVETSSDEEVINIARRNGFNINNYVIEENEDEEKKLNKGYHW